MQLSLSPTDSFPSLGCSRYAKNSPLRCLGYPNGAATSFYFPLLFSLFSSPLWGFPWLMVCSSLFQLALFQLFLLVQCTISNTLRFSRFSIFFSNEWSNRELLETNCEQTPVLMLMLQMCSARPLLLSRPLWAGWTVVRLWIRSGVGTKFLGGGSGVPGWGSFYCCIRLSSKVAIRNRVFFFLPPCVQATKWGKN